MSPSIPSDRASRPEAPTDPTSAAGIAAALAALTLGEGVVLRGVRVVRRSLFGFEVAGEGALVDAPAAAERVGAAAALRRRPHAPGPRPVAPRISVCFRCAGDGLGRRDRGVCGVCHGSGLQIVAPPAGWASAPPAQRAAAVEQATLALRDAHHPQAREALASLLATLRALQPQPVHMAGDPLRGPPAPHAGGRAA